MRRRSWWKPWRRCWGVTAERTSGNWRCKRWPTGDFILKVKQVIDALKAAWKQLDMAMIAAGEKDVYGIGEPEKPPEAIV